jgi:hypothetical protein
MFLYEIPCFNVLMWFKNIYDWLSRFVSLYKTKNRQAPVFIIIEGPVYCTILILYVSLSCTLLIK